MAASTAAIAPAMSSASRNGCQSAKLGSFGRRRTKPALDVAGGEEVALAVDGDRPLDRPPRAQTSARLVSSRYGDGLSSLTILICWFCF